MAQKCRFSQGWLKFKGTTCTPLFNLTATAKTADKTIVGTRIEASLSPDGVPAVTNVVGVSNSTQDVRLTVGSGGAGPMTRLKVAPNEVWALGLSRGRQLLVPKLASSVPFYAPHA